MHNSSAGDPADNRDQLQVPQLPQDQETRQSYFDRLNRYLRLSLSLPERSVRALSALVGGSTMLLSQTLIPTAIKSSSSYRFTLGMFQAFLIRNMAQIQAQTSAEALKDQFVQRKMVGTSLETAGLLTMHLSPVWVFAIASDAAKGGQVFLPRLVHYLKENQVISEDANPQSLEQILEAIHEMGRQGASAIDAPPLSRDEIRLLADELRASTARLAEHSHKLMPRFEAIWKQINFVAIKEEMSVAQVMGILSIHAAAATQIGFGTVGAVGKTGYHFLDEVILTDYKTTLSGISETGAWPYIREHMAPFVENARMHFNFKKETWTERWLKNSFGRFLSKLKSKR